MAANSRDVLKIIAVHEDHINSHADCIREAMIEAWPLGSEIEFKGGDLFNPELYRGTVYKHMDDASHRSRVNIGNMIVLVGLRKFHVHYDQILKP